MGPQQPQQMDQHRMKQWPVAEADLCLTMNGAKRRFLDLIENL
jgi:hypothetical protein